MLCTITGKIKDITGSDLDGQKIVFQRELGVRAQDGVTVIPSVDAEVVADASGDISVTLYPGQYIAHTMGDRGVLKFRAGVPDAATANLHDIIDQLPQITPTVLSEAREARDLALTYRDAAQGHANSASGDATLASQHEAGAEQALADAQQVAYGTDPVFATVKATDELIAPGLPEMLGAIGAQAAALGQVAHQVNGGRSSHTGGSAADPAIEIGTVGIYSAAADTLSIAIAGVEVARFTSSGVTIYGTVTES